jgi:hypothetical protein
MNLFDFPTFRLKTRRMASLSSSLFCDHCCRKLGFRAHSYWHMQFCSYARVTEYRQRLSPETQQKIQLDVRNAGPFEAHN